MLTLTGIRSEVVIDSLPLLVGGSSVVVPAVKATVAPVFDSNIDCPTGRL